MTLIYDAYHSRREDEADFRILEAALLCLRDSDRARCITGLAAFDRLKKKHSRLHVVANAADKFLLRPTHTSEACLRNGLRAIRER